MQFRKICLYALMMLPAALPFSAAQAAPMEWASKQDDGGVYLMWGEPDTDHIPVMFVCNPQTRGLYVRYYVNDDEQEQLVTWSSLNGGQVELRMGPSAPATLENGVEVGGEEGLVADTTLTPELVRILQSGGTLSVRGQSSSVDVPLVGAEKGVAALVQACGPR